MHMCYWMWHRESFFCKNGFSQLLKLQGFLYHEHFNNLLLWAMAYYEIYHLLLYLNSGYKKPISRLHPSCWETNHTIVLHFSICLSLVDGYYLRLATNMKSFLADTAVLNRVYEQSNVYGLILLVPWINSKGKCV